MAGPQPGLGCGKMLREVARAAGGGAGGATEPICLATAVPTRSSRAATPPRGISLPHSSSNASSSLQSSVPTDVGGLVHRPISLPSSVSLQGCDQGGSPVEQEVVGGDDIWANDRVVFGPSPTREEVLRALSTIQRIFVPVTMERVFNDRTDFRVAKNAVDDTSNTPTGVQISAPKSVAAKADSGLPLSNTKMDHSKGVVDAFRSLHVYPSVKKMVVSISSDKAVWDAVMKNDAVKEVKRSFFAVESAKSKPGNTPDFVGTVVEWILNCTKSMLLTFLDKIWIIAKEVLHLNHLNPEVGAKVAAFEEAVRSSFMVSVVVFIVVVLFRVHLN